MTDIFIFLIGAGCGYGFRGLIRREVAYLSSVIEENVVAKIKDMIEKK